MWISFSNKSQYFDQSCNNWPKQKSNAPYFFLWWPVKINDALLIFEADFIFSPGSISIGWPAKKYCKCMVCAKNFGINLKITKILHIFVHWLTLFKMGPPGIDTTFPAFFPILIYLLEHCWGVSYWIIWVESKRRHCKSLLKWGTKSHRELDLASSVTVVALRYC